MTMLRPCGLGSPTAERLLTVPVDPLDLAAALADARDTPLPSIGLPAHLWLLGIGSHHDFVVAQILKAFLDIEGMLQ